MTTLKSFTQAKARPLSVIILADVSSSMSVDGKIDALNRAIENMIHTFAEEEAGRAEIQVAVITFGCSAQVHLPLKPARETKWEPMSANGSTAMGAAINLAAEFIEDRENIPSRAYRPTVILVSDGIPTDSWKAGLQKLTEKGRAGKASRMALAIGADADEAMLRQFVGGEEPTLYKAEDARQISNFFQFVTMTVTTQTRSPNPNAIPEVDDPFGLKF